MISRLLERLQIFSLRRLSAKLIWTYILLTVIPMSLIGYISYYQYTKSIEEEYGAYMPRYLKLANASIEQQVKELMNLPDLIYSSDDIVTIFRKKNYALQSDFQQDKFTVNNFLSRTYINGNNPDIIGVFMVTHQAVFASARMNYSGFDPDDEPIQYHNELQLKGNAAIILPSQINIRFEQPVPYFVLMKEVSDFDNRKSLGTMYIAVGLSFIDEILSDNNEYEPAAFWMMNPSGQIIYHTDKNQIGDFDEEISRYPVMNGSFRNNHAEQVQLVSIRESGQFDWVLVHSIPLRNLTEQIDLARNITIFVFFICALITSVLSIWLALRVSGPVKKLSQSMKHVEMGHFNVVLQVQGRDEMSLLTRSFNSMIATIRNLIQKNYSIEIKQKEAEFYALQAQINPHFMYNTLETIGMAVEDGESDLVVEMVTLLGRMLRFSLSNQDRLVRVEEEVQHVKDYLTIQKIRFEDRIQFRIDVRPDLDRLYVPKFILQPIVENAIKYGLDTRKCLQIHIAVNQEFSASSGDESLIIRIRDSGPGISSDRLQEIELQLQADPLSKAESGFGLRNVHARIVMMFGDRYGLQLDSVEGLGTEVILRIPLISTTAEKQRIETEEAGLVADNSHDDRG